MTAWQFANLICFILVIGIMVTCFSAALVIAYQEHKEKYRDRLQRRLSCELSALELRAALLAEEIRSDAEGVSREMARQAQSLRE